MKPSIFNIFKPAGMTSYQVVGHFKKNLPKPFGKIGHFGTLDPFACGVLMVGISGASRLNEYVHKYMPKTYLAIGKLGVSTETGDLTILPSFYDDGPYLKNTIAAFSKEFIDDQIKRNFIGEYWQAPHAYSAAKYEGKKLCDWAREGIEIQKEKKLRNVYELSAVKYSFPYLSIRATVSSGTYIRTLFQDIARYLGTYGTLVSLVRESVGKVDYSDSLRKSSWPIRDDSSWDISKYSMPMDEVLNISKITLSGRSSELYGYGNPITLKDDESQITQGEQELEEDLCWVYDDKNSLYGLAEKNNQTLKPKFNLPK